MTHLIVGTRGSSLALTQTTSVVEALRKAHPQCEFTVRVIKTQGDKDTISGLDKIGGQGVFVKELEEQLLSRSIDIAVHSLKDMPGSVPAGLTIGAVPAREDVRDALISRSGLPLGRLPPGSTIGTGSPRRTVQLRLVRPDLKAAPVRGNVDTRIRKMHAGEVDAVILAAAGLQRLGLSHLVTEFLDTENFLPAVGQAALAVEIRAADREIEDLVSVVDHLPTRQAVTAERAFLGGLGGGCQAPIAAHAVVNGKELDIDGMVAAPDGYMALRDRQKGSTDSPGDAGYLLAARLIGRGAASWL
ncbi:MAG: hydroxymethylbilane synthase [Chloroflexi bacterium]|nr:hydroxymethylbilane synthase [Chloroflexota bacterium]